MLVNLQGLNWAWQELSLRNSVVTRTFIYAEFFNTTVFISAITYQTADTTKSFSHLDQQVVSHVASIWKAKCSGWPEGILRFSIICKNVENKITSLVWLFSPSQSLTLWLAKNLWKTILRSWLVHVYGSNVFQIIKFWFHNLRLLSCSFYLNEFLY